MLLRSCIKLALPTRCDTPIPVAAVTVIDVLAAPMVLPLQEVCIPAALVNEFEKASAICLYLLCLFINRQERLQVQVKHLV